MSHKLTLLYAEDESETRSNHIEYLKARYDFEFLEAGDGEEALSLFKRHKPQIILTDINMPHMDGLSFIKEVRALSPHTKIVILSAHDDRDRLMTALGLDVVNYLLKPINRKKLSAAVDLALETLPRYDEGSYICRIDSNTRWDEQTKELYRDGEVIVLTQFEKRLLSLLCGYKNSEVSSHDIFFHVWRDFETEYNESSVRTLVKKLRKKLPEGTLLNSYGGYYRLA